MCSKYQASNLDIILRVLEKCIFQFVMKQYWKDVCWSKKHFFHLIIQYPDYLQQVQKQFRVEEVWQNIFYNRLDISPEIVRGV